MAKVYTKEEEALFMKKVTCHPIQQLDEEHVAGILKLKDRYKIRSTQSDFRVSQLNNSIYTGRD